MMPIALGTERPPSSASTVRHYGHTPPSYSPETILWNARSWRPSGPRPATRCQRDQAAAGEILGLLFAGTETTAATVLWALVHASRRPAEWDRLRDDPNSVRAYTLETLATHAARRGDSLGRRQVDRAVLTSGDIEQVVRRPLVVSIYLRAINRDPELWPEPLRFDPDTLQCSRPRTTQRASAVGARTRGCIGQHLAMTEIAKLLPMLAHSRRRFDWPRARGRHAVHAPATRRRHRSIQPTDAVTPAQHRRDLRGAADEIDAPALVLMGKCVSVLDHLDCEARVGEMLGELVSPVARPLTSPTWNSPSPSCTASATTPSGTSDRRSSVRHSARSSRENILKDIEGHDATRGARQDRKRADISSNDSHSRHSSPAPEHRPGEINRNRTRRGRSDKRRDALVHIRDRAPALVAGIAPPGHRARGDQARASGDRH